MKRTLLFLISSLLFSSKTFSQDESMKSVVAVSGGLGVLTFNGDIGKGKKVSKYTYIRGGYAFNAERRFLKEWMGASLNMVTGKLAMGERSVDTARNKNFESKIMQFGLNLNFYLQNKKGTPIIPYLSTGFVSLSLDARTDLFYAGDSLNPSGKYYYWSDGSIRNQPETPSNEFSAQHVNRDYIYETKLNGAASGTMSLPVGFGFKMKIGNNAEANLGATYYMGFTDDIDAFKTGGNDAYMYSYFSLTYNFTGKSREEREREKKSSNVDFAKLDKQDMDGDQVIDKEDLCPGTPKGVKVDSRGCPNDEDGDGVPDYLDKEKDTKKGSIVDTDGRTLTDAIILERAMRDSIASSRNDIFKNNPSLASLKAIESQIKQKHVSVSSKIKIPPQFQSADTDKDGIISSDEITAIIDGFFDGSNDYTVEKIHALIDYFFEQ